MAPASKVGVGDELVRYKFIQALPLEITPVIAAIKNASLIELGTLAGEIGPFLKPCIMQNATVPRNTSRRTRATVSIGATPKANYRARINGHKYIVDIFVIPMDLEFVYCDVYGQISSAAI